MSFRKQSTLVLVAFLGTTLSLTTAFFSYQWLFEVKAKAAYQALNTFQMAVIGQLHERLIVLSALESYVITYQGQHPDSIWSAELFDSFNKFSASIKKTTHGIRSLQLAPDAIVSVISDVENNQNVLGHDLLVADASKAAVLSAIKSRSQMFVGPVELIQSGQAFIVRKPVYTFSGQYQPSRYLANERALPETAWLNEIPDDFWGFVTVIIDFPTFIDELSTESEESFDFALGKINTAGQSAAVIIGDPSIFQSPLHKVDIEFDGNHWQAAVVLQNPVSMWPFILLAAVGLMMTAYIVWLMQKSQRVNAEKEMSHSKLLELTAQQQKIHQSLQEVVDLQTLDLIVERDKALQLSEAKSRFVANISHELRTPMHAIKSFASIVQKKLKDEKLLRYIDNISTSADRLNRVIDDLLDLSKLEGGFQPSFQEVDLVRTIRYAIEELSAVSSKNGLIINFTPDRAFTCTADRGLIMQLMINLLGNANKYAASGGKVDIVIKEVTGVEPDSNESNLQVSVRDYGPGVPVEELETVFESFQQSSVTDKGAGGTGLGLSICKKIINAHGGDIWVNSHSSEVPVGAAFVFRLPVKQRMSESVADDDSDSANVTVSVDSLLLVDDNPLIRVMAEEIFNPTGIKIYAVETVYDAFDILDQSDIDAVLTDIYMPDINGIEFVKKLRKSEYAGLVLGLSASTEPKLKKEFLAAGGNALLSKPISLEKFNRALSQLAKK